MEIGDYDLYEGGKITFKATVGKVIYRIKRAPKNIMQSGDDSFLTNFWDEVCVQVQDEYWTCWSLYEYYIEQTILSIIDALTYNKRRALSYFLYWEKEFEEPHEDLGYYPDLCQEMLLNEILELALNYRNLKIQKYLDSRYLD